MESHQRILVVSEDSAMLDQIGRFLAEQGYQLRCATSSDEALVCYPSWPAELVISDHTFSAMRGMDLADQLRKVNNRARFILITPPGETPDFGSGVRNRIVAFLSKPCSPEDLAHYVRGALGLSESVPNRREHNRYMFDIETHCILINPYDNTESRPIPALLRDISRSGISMIVRQLFPIPSMIKMMLNFNPAKGPTSLLAKSIACTLTQIPGVYRMGAKFAGLLPDEVEQAIIDLSHQSGTDIYMGKTFKSAVGDWLALHQEKLAGEDVPGMDRPLEELQEEMGHNPIDGELKRQQQRD